MDPLVNLDWLGDWARTAPDRAVVIDADTGERWTYRRLEESSRRVEAWMERRFAPKAGDRLAILGANSILHLLSFFACWRRGWTLVPLNWRLAPRELDAVLEDASACGLLSEDGSRGGVAFEEALQEAERAEPSTVAPSTRPEDVSLILYTSGTTGRPKGAMLSARMIVANAIQTVTGWELSSSDSAPLFAPLFHTGGWNVLTIPLLNAGGRVLLMRRFDPAAVICWLPETSVLFGVPTMFQALAEAGLLLTPAPRLRFVISGGAPCPTELIQRYLDAGVPFRQGFGMTEVGPNCFRFPPGREREKAGSVGLPQVGTRMRLVDGELHVAGAHVFSGYWRNAEATSHALRDGWVATGDVAEVDADGLYRIVGRKKEMFISGGENVYPGEVERVLVDHPHVAEAAVVGVPDARWGEVGHAFVVPRGTLEESDLARFSRERLAGYKVPRRFTIVSELPRNSMGKVVKSLLESLCTGGGHA